MPARSARLANHECAALTSVRAENAKLTLLKAANVADGSTSELSGCAALATTLLARRAATCWRGLARRCSIPTTGDEAAAAFARRVRVSRAQQRRTSGCCVALVSIVFVSPADLNSAQDATRWKQHKGRVADCASDDASL